MKICNLVPCPVPTSLLGDNFMTYLDQSWTEEVNIRKICKHQILNKTQMLHLCQQLCSVTNGLLKMTIPNKLLSLSIILKILTSMFMFTEIDLQTFTRISLNMKLCFVQVLTGHTGSVLCLQYDDKVIISGSSDSTVRVWDVATGEMVNTLIHHCEAVLHLRFCNGMMVTCSKVI